LTDPRKWLTARLIAAPESLRATVHEAAHPAMRRASGSVERDFADVLMAAAERVVRSPAAPAAPAACAAAASALLTADALVTLACEWVAEHEPERLGEMQ